MMKVFALSTADFYDEKGQLIDVKIPPYFDYNYNSCEWHRLNILTKGSTEYPFKYTRRAIFSASRWCLIQANNEISGLYHDLYIVPPPYYWRGEITYGFRERWLKLWENTFFNRYSIDFERPGGWVWDNILEYSEYVQKYEYLFYWFDLYNSLEIRILNEKLHAKENEIRERTEKGEYVGNSLKEEVDELRKKIERVYERKPKISKMLHLGLEDITERFLVIYEECINLCHDSTALYQRGRIFFDQGKTVEFLGDVASLVEAGYNETPEIVFELGKAYSDANRYNEAIKALSCVIEKDPENKEAYFERALAYFESGEFNLALEDYISSGKHPTFLREKAEELSEKFGVDWLQYCQGAMVGICKGGCDSIEDFVPSLLSTVWGMGKGLWAFASDPIELSVEFVESSVKLIKFVKDNLSVELLAEVVPELRECLLKWDQLEDRKKGEYIGYVIGRYGVDILAWKGSVKGIQLYRNLKRANAMMALEASTVSLKQSKEILKASEEFFQFKDEYLKKCYLSITDQNKHIPGMKNYKKNTSDLLISIEELDKETRRRMGMGWPDRGMFAQAGYQEFVIYDKEIGVIYSITGEKLPTKVGKIHYNKKGGYHVVPSHPDVIKIKSNK